VAIAGMAREDILTTGLILILVEAISMSAGSFLSESSAEEFETHQEISTDRSYLSAFVMFISYFVSGFIPLAPYLLLTGSLAFITSIAVSLGTLFLLGVVSAHISKTRRVRGAFRMALIGGLAIGAGVLVGGFVG
jgi:VIT1/CCC1 family predicted Fe2+/Mn2+ transporter